MKLVLKNKQEIEIAGMNNSFSFEKFKDGKGCLLYTSDAADVCSV